MTTSRNSAPRKRRETAGSHLFRQQAYYRSKTRAVWLAAGAAAIMAVILPFWITPSIPIGMTEDDYSFSVWVALVLTMGSTVMALLAFLAREPIAGEEGLAEAWHSLMGKPMMVRNRRQFHNRLLRECKLAQRDRRRALSLLLVRVDSRGDCSTEGGPEPLAHIADALVATMRHSDVVGIAEDDEIGVLAIGADAKGREVVRERFEQTLATACADWVRAAGASGDAPAVSLGTITFDPDSDPDALLESARQALTPIGSHVTQAA